LSEKGIAVIVK